MLSPEFNCGERFLHNHPKGLAGTLPQEELKGRVLDVRDKNSDSWDIEFAACLLSD